MRPRRRGPAGRARGRRSAHFVRGHVPRRRARSCPVSALTGAGHPGARATRSRRSAAASAPARRQRRLPHARRPGLHHARLRHGRRRHGPRRVGPRGRPDRDLPRGPREPASGASRSTSPRPTRSGIGRRTALNLQDVAKEDLRRGQVAAAEGSLAPTARLDARLDVLAGTPPRDQAPRPRPAAHRHGRGHGPACPSSADRRSRPAPRLADPARARAARRSPSPGTGSSSVRSRPSMTIGGGRVLDAAPEKHKRFSGSSSRGSRSSGGPARDAVEQMFAQVGRDAPRRQREMALKARPRRARGRRGRSRRSRRMARSSPSPARNAGSLPPPVGLRHTGSATSSAAWSGLLRGESVQARRGPTRTSGPSSSKRATRATPEASCSTASSRRAYSCARTPASVSPARGGRRRSGRGRAPGPRRGRVRERPFRGSARGRRPDRASS
ncbi:MAG: hypothetical protein MZW92_03290 [Comamonadaceae bacterium]|nr:hypothetical protein [Comamonadaceae bacterium]